MTATFSNNFFIENLLGLKEDHNQFVKHQSMTFESEGTID